MFEGAEVVGACALQRGVGDGTDEAGAFSERQGQGDDRL